MIPAPCHSHGREEPGTEDGALIDAAREVLQGRAGTPVRSVPHRRTLRHELADGRCVFCKLRDRRPKDAQVEWHWLHELPRLGFQVSRPVLLTRDGNHSAVCTLGVSGRSLQLLIGEALEAGGWAEVSAYAEKVVAPVVRRLHRQSLVFRDLYWNHLYAESLEDLSVEPTFIDVERVFRPRWCWRRWQVKDLAGLVSSLPDSASPRILRRAFLSYLGASDGQARRLSRAVLRKAARIREHQPRYPG